MFGYGLGFYRWGMWFGFGQIRFCRWAIDLCLFKRAIEGAEPYNRYWFTVGRCSP